MRDLEDKKYTLQEVKELLREQSFDYENALADQKERIFALIKENEQTLLELEKFKKKDEAISSALVLAVQKAKEIEKSAKKKFEGNLIRLKIFEAKLANYYKKLVEKYPLDDTLQKTEDFIKKMDEILGTDYLKLGGEEKMFKAENPTLLTGGYLNYMDIKSDSGFDINEALNPSEDLEEICKELGLI